MYRGWSFLLCVVAGCAPLDATNGPVAPTVGGSAADGPSRMLVTADRTCSAREGTCGILEVVDLHTRANSEDKGFDELRARAAALGADAVIGAEFEHGSEGEPSHLSGLIVRYGPPAPAYVDIGEVAVASDPNASDKGLAELIAKSRAIGGDRVVGVTFEHGEDGKPGQVKGRAVRYVR